MTPLTYNFVTKIVIELEEFGLHRLYVSLFEWNIVCLAHLLVIRHGSSLGSIDTTG